MSLNRLQEIVKDREAWHTAGLCSCKESGMTERLNNNNVGSPATSSEQLRPRSLPRGSTPVPRKRRNPAPHCLRL